VISDYNMPEMDGLTLAKELLGRKYFRPSALIMLTSGIRPQDEREFQRLGIGAQLLKPAKQSEIYNAVVNALAAEHSASPLPGQSGNHPARVGASPSWQILLAEDNKVNQKLAIGLLEKLGHQVTVAQNGLEALECLADKEFDLVLMDVQMPEMDGFHATEELRRREAKSGFHVPVVAMTAHAMKGDRDNCLVAGMDDYLCKPIRARDLSEMLESLAGRFPRLTRIRSAPNGETPRSQLPGTDTAYHQVDWEKARRNSAGDAELLQELLQTLMVEIPKLVGRMEAALAIGDRAKICATAHSLKGSLGFLATKTAHASCEAIELTSPHWNESELERAWHDCRAEIEQVVNEVKSRLR
jgi:CheY-like chemotaxis protein